MARRIIFEDEIDKQNQNNTKLDEELIIKQEVEDNYSQNLNNTNLSEELIIKKEVEDNCSLSPNNIKLEKELIIKNEVEDTCSQNLNNTNLNEELIIKKEVKDNYSQNLNNTNLCEELIIKKEVEDNCSLSPNNIKLDKELIIKKEVEDNCRQEHTQKKDIRNFTDTNSGTECSTKNSEQFENVIRLGSQLRKTIEIPIEYEGNSQSECNIGMGKPKGKRRNKTEQEMFGININEDDHSQDDEFGDKNKIFRKQKLKKIEQRTAYNYPMADKPDEPMDLTDLLLPSRSNAPVETQDAAASTSATPFAEPPTIDAPKSSAQRQREYRQRIAASKTLAQSTATRISETKRKRNYRLRKAANWALASGTLESTTASSSRSAGRSNDVQNSTQRQLTNQQRQSLAAEPAETTVQPGTFSDQIEVPDEPKDLTDLPLPWRSNAPVETQDAAASTSATPFVEPPTIAAPKSSAQRQREYRQRIAASKTLAQSTATRISETKRKRNYRRRKAANLSLASDSLESTTASSSRSAGRSNDAQNSTQRQLLAAESAQTTVQPGTFSDQIEVTDEPTSLTDLPLPSRSNAPVETKDAAASTSATPFAEPPTIAAPKSSAQRQREYRQRIAASRTLAQSTATRISETKRKRNYRRRKAANLALASGSSESTTPSSIMRFTSTFLNNDFGYTCSVCDRLSFKNDLKPITAAQLKVISDWFIKKNRQFCREEYELVCNTCKRSLNKKSMPPLAKVNGFSYPDRPPDLPPLDPISERLKL